jgi:thiol-disulfide isomerase/thioredoxin
MHKLFLAALLLCALPLAGRADDTLDRLRALKFTAVDGQKVDVGQMRGKVVLIDFWATWCPPCREEVPMVVAAYKKFHDQGFEVVGISLDHDKDTLINFMGRHGMTWPQYFDGGGWDNQISSSFGVQQVPIMVLLGRDGKPVEPDGDLSSTVEKALKAGSP